MLDTIAASVGVLSRSYPSTNRHMSKLFSQYLNFGVDEETAEYYVRDQLPTGQGWVEEGDEEHVVVIVETDCADEAFFQVGSSKHAELCFRVGSHYVWFYYRGEPVI